MPKYSKKAQEKVEKVMHERKEGTLRSGGSGKKVTSRKQAIAIGLSEAREEGAKVPQKKGAKKSTGGRKSASSRKSATKSTSGSRSRTGAKKSTGRKSTRKKSASM